MSGSLTPQDGAVLRVHRLLLCCGHHSGEADVLTSPSIHALNPCPPALDPTALPLCACLQVGGCGVGHWEGRRAGGRSLSATPAAPGCLVHLAPVCPVLCAEWPCLPPSSVPEAALQKFPPQVAVLSACMQERSGDRVPLVSCVFPRTQTLANKD